MEISLKTGSKMQFLLVVRQVVRFCSAATVDWPCIDCIIYWESSYLTPFFLKQYHSRNFQSIFFEMVVTDICYPFQKFSLVKKRISQAYYIERFKNVTKCVTKHICGNRDRNNVCASVVLSIGQQIISMVYCNSIQCEYA